MNTVFHMKPKQQQLSHSYLMALKRFLAQGPSASLHPALKLGSHALTLGLETLDLALIHEQTLSSLLLPVNDATTRSRFTEQARSFFAEAIIPIERTHKVAMESTLHLGRLNRGLTQRTKDLVASNRQLKREIVRRLSVEKTLLKSEQHSSRLLKQSQLLQEQLRLLSRGILSVQEDERKRISRELHDVIAQMLTGINVRLASLKQEASANTKDIEKSISKTQRLVEKSVAIVHRFACELRPAVLDDLGLIPALHTYLKAFSKKTGIRARLIAFAGVEKLSSTKRTALYRVTHEALANVARHAAASKVEISIHRISNAVTMDITDNGKGFDANQVLYTNNCKRLGLLGIRERVEMLGGKFAIISAPGKGTTIHTQIPFKEHSRS